MLDRRVLDNETGAVDLEAWKLRVAIGGGVGRCTCGGPLMPGEPDPDLHVTWLPIRCTACGAVQTLIAERPVRQRYARTG